MELSSKYQADDYIQHNPNVPTGRAAFVTFFQNVVGVKPANPIPATLSPAPVVSGAKGDFVFLIFEQESPDPRDPTKTYHSNSFEVLRLAERQSAGALGQRQAHGGAARRAEAAAVRAAREPDGARQHRHAVGRRAPQPRARRPRAEGHAAVRPSRARRHCHGSRATSSTTRTSRRAATASSNS